MLTIFSFLIALIGGVNWLMIGLLQYDFIAGIFGYQASIFSRIIYIIFGLSSIILLFKMFKGKGTIAVFSRKNKKDLKKNIDKINSDERMQVAGANVEASQEHFQERKPRSNEEYSRYSQPDYSQMPNEGYSHNQWQGYYEGSNYPSGQSRNQYENHPPRDDYNPRADANFQGGSSEDGLFDEHLGRR